MYSSIKRRIALGAALFAGLLAQVANAQTYGTNLLVNGDAEANAIVDLYNGIGAHGLEPGVDVVPAGWTRVYGKYIAVTKNNTYWSAYGSPFFVKPGPGINSNFFVGGHASAGAQMYQVVDLSAFATAIDQSAALARIDARIGTYTNQTDGTEVTAYFYDGANNYLGQFLTLGEINNRIYNNPLVDLDLNFVTPASGIVPPGTRKVAFYVTARRHQGSDDDSYSDDLSFQLLPRIASVAASVAGSHWEEVKNSLGKRINWRLVQDIQIQNTGNVSIQNLRLTAVTYNNKSAYVTITVAGKPTKVNISTTNPLTIAGVLAGGGTTLVSVPYLYPNSTKPPLTSGARYPLRISGDFVDAVSGRPGSFSQSLRGVPAP